MTRMIRSTVFAILVLGSLVATSLVATAAPPKDAQRLSQSLDPLIKCVAGKTDSFCLTVQVDAMLGSKHETITVRLDQAGAETINLEIKHKDYWVRLERRPNQTAMILPLHKVAFVGSGAVSKTDNLAPAGLLGRLIGSGSMVGVYLPLLTGGDTSTLSLMLTSLLSPTYDEETKTWSHKDQYFVRFSDDSKTVTFEYKTVNVKMQLTDATITDRSPIAVDEFKVTTIEREELERHLARGIRRTFEVLAPSPLLTAPDQTDRTVANGQLRWIGGQRVALLHGTPQQIGAAHGKLLAAELNHCVDSVLYAFGTFQTIRSGRWFMHDLQTAYQRLSPYIPDDHKAETLAMAKSINFDPETAQIMNVFPELFHCSGFAVFGKATKDGKLYHGRVLDYMTTIGLQDSATTFVIAPDGKIPFVNIGYAGFIGSVSGMNAQGISLGEMGGRGEGQWDGVPMATLMRRALEECDTLAEVKTLWTDSPRTCEYYYVFADGKTNEAVGVSATPDKIEFVEPGQSHALLGEGIADTVLLSSGSRLETLRSRVQERYGQFDVENGKWLMSRPVAMQSNLHNVLFVPQDGVLLVANADHQSPAAERPYVKLNLHELLQSMQVPQAASSK